MCFINMDNVDCFLNNIGKMIREKMFNSNCVGGKNSQHLGRRYNNEIIAKILVEN